MLLGCCNVNSFWVMDGGVIFNECGDDPSILLEEMSSPVAHISKALDHIRLPSNPFLNSSLLTEAVDV